MSGPRGEGTTEPALATDCVVFDRTGRVLLIRRGQPPFEGELALPGGFIEPGERTEAACRRELMEETGIAAGALELVGVYSDPARDPRGHVISVVYVTVIDQAAPKAGDDAAQAEWVADWRDQTLAFDHAKIIADAERRLAGGPVSGS